MKKVIRFFVITSAYIFVMIAFGWLSLKVNDFSFPENPNFIDVFIAFWTSILIAGIIAVMIILSVFFVYLLEELFF